MTCVRCEVTWSVDTSAQAHKRTFTAAQVSKEIQTSLGWTKAAFPLSSWVLQPDDVCESKLHTSGWSLLLESKFISRQGFSQCQVGNWYTIHTLLKIVVLNRQLSLHLSHSVSKRSLDTPHAQLLQFSQWDCQDGHIISVSYHAGIYLLYNAV